MKHKLTQDFVKKLKPTERRNAIFDTEISGFGIRVNKSGIKTFVLKYTNQYRKQKFYTIGKYGNLTVDMARKQALKLRGEIADGKDPQQEKQEKRNVLSVKELCEKYLENGCGHKKESTIKTDKGRINRHIIPLIGNIPLQNLSQNDILKLQKNITLGKTACTEKTSKHGMAIVSGGSGTATRTLGLLGGILTYAINNGYIEKNPYIGIKRTPDKKMERYLSSEEINKLWHVLDDSKNINIYAIYIIKLLLLTGCRKSEIVKLKRSEIDFENSALNLEDTKTGASKRNLSADALSLLSEIPMIIGSEYVFIGNDINKPYAGLDKIWRKIREKAGLSDVRLHDLRHTYSSIAANSGQPISVISKLLGHKDSRTTQRYVHIDQSSTKSSADEIGLEIAKSISK